jgi:HTH-type transcriptional regulator/antitoxin HigA
MSRGGATSRKARSARPLAASDDYLELVKALPIRPIQTDAEYAAAQDVLDRLIGREDLTPGQRDYLAALVRFVADYEREQHLDRLQRLTPIELLRQLLESNGMTTSDLGEVLGSRGLASEVLNGKRGLSKAAIGRLSARFGVDPGLFLKAAEREQRVA